MDSVPILFAAAPDWLVSWITTLWLLSGGVLLGMVVLMLLWGVLWVIWRRAAREVPLVISEGVLLPLTFIAGAIAVFAVIGTVLVREPAPILQSIWRLPSAGNRRVVATIPVNSQKMPVRIALHGNEAVKLAMSADELVEVANAANEEDQYGPVVEVGPSQASTWTRRGQIQPLFSGEYVENLYVTNLADHEATFTIEMTTGPSYPEVMAVPITAAAVVGLYLIYFLQAWCFPKVSAIALSTTKSELAQPLFGILTALGIFLLLLFLYLPYNTFGEDIKMLKDSALTLIMIMGIIQGVWSASNSVSEEIEGRTALTVLSKPIGRRQFLFGKFAGILWTVLLLFVILGVTLIILVAYKPVYDGARWVVRHPSGQSLIWKSCSPCPVWCWRFLRPRYWFH